MSNRYGPRIVTDGLVLCLDAADRNSYPGSGTTWYDLSGNNNIGYIGNNNSYLIDYFNSAYAPIFTNDSGGSFLFDGVNDHVVFPDSPSLRYIGSSISFFAWAKPTIEITTARNIIARRDYSNIGGYILHNNSNNSLQCYVYNTTWRAATVASVYETNKWSYVGCTYTGTQIKLYKNGQNIAIVNAGSGDINPIESTTRIGSNGTGSQPWAGHISHVQIYNSLLNDSEVLQNYNATKGRFNL